MVASTTEAQSVLLEDPRHSHEAADRGSGVLRSLLGVEGGCLDRRLLLVGRVLLVLRVLRVRVFLCLARRRRENGRARVLGLALRNARGRSFVVRAHVPGRGRMHLGVEVEVVVEAEASLHRKVHRDAEDFPSRVKTYSSSIRRAGAGVPGEISIGDSAVQNANEEQSANDDVPENEDANANDEVVNVDESAHERNEEMSANARDHDEEDREETEQSKGD